MKAGIVVLLLLCLAAERGLARQGLEAITPDSKAAVAGLFLKEDMRLTQPEVIAGKDFQLSGPLVRPFKSKRFREVPRRLLHLINPFAATAPGEQLERARDLNPRAWASTVGWSTGCSSAPVEVTREPTMGLISASRR
jgi:hypothetical protein